jgi:2-methylfumaryl-CoA isomerase
MPSEPPLAGMSITEFGSYVAVPSGGMTLASLGARVTRIDPIGGASDINRAPLGPDGTSIYWASMNKGKRSIVLDLRTPEGQELASAIATAPGPDSGFFISNAVGDGWHSHDRLSSRRDDLIWIRLQGYADGGPALDYSVNWEIGFAAATGPADTQSPTLHVLPAWDLLAGMHVAISLLASERRRARTGEGQAIRISLMDVALWATDALGIFNEIEILGTGRGRTGDFVYGTFGTPFTTADGDRFMVVALTKRQWRDLIAVTGVGEAVSGLQQTVREEFDDEHARWRHRDDLRAIIAPWFARRTSVDVRKQLETTRLIWSPLKTFEEALRNAIDSKNPLLRNVEHPLLGAARGMTFPGAFASGFDHPTPVAPVLGADTERVLAEALGLTANEIGSLLDRGVAASAP